MTSVDSNFNFLCGRPHGVGPPPPVHMRPPEPDPLPLRVDVINGWPVKQLQTVEKFLVNLLIAPTVIGGIVVNCKVVNSVNSIMNHDSLEAVQKVRHARGAEDPTRCDSL